MKLGFGGGLLLAPMRGEALPAIMGYNTRSSNHRHQKQQHANNSNAEGYP